MQQMYRAVRLEIINRAANIISRTATQVLSDQDDVTVIDTAVQDLSINFNFSKNPDQSEDKDVGSISIKGLSADTVKQFGFRFARVKLFTKYLSSGLPYQLLFEADVTGVEFRKDSGTEVTLQLVGNIVKTTLAKKISFSAPENSDFVTVLNGLVKTSGFAGFNAEFSKDENLTRLFEITYPYGYSATGTPQEVLDTFFRSYNLAWRVSKDNSIEFSPHFVGSLNVREYNVTVLSEETGLIGLPYLKTQDYTKSVDEAVEENELNLGVKVTTKKDGSVKESKKRRVRKVGVEMKALINPTIEPNSVVQVSTAAGVADGLYRVRSVKFSGETHGSNWYMEIFGEDTGREF